MLKKNENKSNRGRSKGAAFNHPMEPMGVEPVLLTCEASVLPIGLRPQLSHI